MVGNEIDAVIEAMSEEQLDTFLEGIRAEPEMVQTALELAVKILIEFINRHELTDQFVSEVAPNEMVAVIIATQGFILEEES